MAVALSEVGGTLPPLLLYLFTQKFGECCCQIFTVDPSSPAEMAVIQPGDSVQLACIVDGLHFDDLLCRQDRGGLPVIV